MWWPTGTASRPTELYERRPSVRRGEVWFVSLDPTRGSEQAKTLPCVVVQRNVNGGNTTTVIPLTNRGDRLPSVIRPLLIAGGDAGLTKDSLALCDQVRTVDRVRLVNKIGELAVPEMALVARGLFEILDLGAAR